MQKKFFTLYLAFLCSLTVMAQSFDPKASIGTEIVDQLRATTTVFFYSQGSEIDSIKQAVTEGWKLTPLIFDDISNFAKYASEPKYSYFIIERYTVHSTSGSRSYTNTYYFLNLRLFKEVNKKGATITTGLCRVELYPNTQTLFMGGKGENLYNKAAFYNWSPILLKAQLEVVSDNLERHFIPNHYYEYRDKELTNILSNDTLYVPQRLLMSFNALTAAEKVKKETVFDGYRYKFRICTDDELFDLFQTSKKGRLLFEYVKSSTDKLITIYDLQQKKVIYRTEVDLSYNLKSKDIKRIK
jgi:hypothetical protein